MRETETLSSVISKEKFTTFNSLPLNRVKDAWSIGANLNFGDEMISDNCVSQFTTPAQRRCRVTWPRQQGGAAHLVLQYNPDTLMRSCDENMIERRVR